MRPELDRDAAQDQQPEHDHQGQVKAAEGGGVYVRGNDMNKTPPAAISQTSLPSQTGPMAASTVRRSWSVRATKR